MRAGLRGVGRAIRLGEWWGFKMGPLLGLVLAEVLLDDVPPSEAAVQAGLVVVSGACVAAYGHVANDIADIAADAAAGKPNAAATWPAWARATVPLGLLAATFGVWAARPLSAVALALLMAEAAVLTLYALPPVRLKTRGRLGVAADAAYAHLLPVLFVLAVFRGGTHPAGWSAAWTAALSVWAAAFGVRGILLHQLWDLGNDRRAGVATLAVGRGREAVRRWGRWAYRGEVVAAVAVVGVLGSRAPVVAGALAAVTAVTLVGKWRGWGPSPSFEPMPPSRGDHVPLTLAYMVWPGLVVGATLVVGEAAYVPLVGCFVVAMGYPLAQVGWSWARGLPPSAQRRLRRLRARLGGG